MGKSANIYNQNFLFYNTEMSCRGIGPEKTFMLNIYKLNARTCVNTWIAVIL